MILSGYILYFRSSRNSRRSMCTRLVCTCQNLDFILVITRQFYVMVATFDVNHRLLTWFIVICCDSSLFDVIHRHLLWFIVKSLFKIDVQAPGLCMSESIFEVGNRKLMLLDCGNISYYECLIHSAGWTCRNIANACQKFIHYWWILISSLVNSMWHWVAVIDIKWSWGLTRTRLVCACQNWINHEFILFDIGWLYLIRITWYEPSAMHQRIWSGYD